MLYHIKNISDGEYVLGLVFPRTVVVLASFARIRTPLSTIYVTMDFIMTLFVVPPDILTEIALLTWLPDGHTNSFIF